MRDRQMPWEPSLVELTQAAQNKPDPMRYDATWRAHVVDLWRQVAGIPSVFEEKS
jgi:hypothetical protein